MNTSTHVIEENNLISNLSKKFASSVNAPFWKTDKGSFSEYSLEKLSVRGRTDKVTESVGSRRSMLALTSAIGTKNKKESK